jgi:hypothetical protein
VIVSSEGNARWSPTARKSWVELGFADLFSPVAVGASFEGLADFLISRISETYARPSFRETE